MVRTVPPMAYALCSNNAGDEFAEFKNLTQLLPMGFGDDLLKFKEGKLLGFLLRLSPEQQKLAAWNKSATGPTLLKGGPGTGKSTIALYRVKTRVSGRREPFMS